MAGFGTLRQMNDTIKHNRELLRKKVTFRDRYKEEVEKIPSRFDHVNIEYLRSGFLQDYKKDLLQRRILRVILVTLAIVIAAGLIASIIVLRK